jgi:hypothetical protein
MILDREITRTLRATGLPWSVEPRGRHYKVRLAGRLIGVISLARRGNDNKNLMLRIRAAMRRDSRQGG